MSECTATIWTLTEADGEESLKVPSSNGKVVRIQKQEYGQDDVKRFQRQYDQGEIWGGWLLQRILYDKKASQNNPWLRPHLQEEYLSVTDYVVSEKGVLLGFYVGKVRILWIEDFIDYDPYDGVITPDTLLQEWQEADGCIYQEFGNLRMTSWF